MTCHWFQSPGAQERFHIAAYGGEFLKGEQFLPHQSLQMIFSRFYSSFPETTKVWCPLGAAVPCYVVIERVGLDSILDLRGGQHPVQLDQLILGSLVIGAIITVHVEWQSPPVHKTVQGC